MKKEEDWEKVERKLRKGDYTVRPRLKKALPDLSTYSNTRKDYTIHYIILFGVLGVAIILLIGICMHSYLNKPDLNVDYFTNINKHPVEIRNITNIQRINKFIEPDADYNCLRLQMGDENEFFLRCDINE